MKFWNEIVDDSESSFFGQTTNGQIMMCFGMYVLVVC